KTAAKRIALVAGSGAATLAIALVCGSHWGTHPLTSSNALAQLTAPLKLSAGPIQYRDPFDWLPVGIGVVELGTLIAVAYMAFRVALPGRLPLPGMRALA